MKHLFTLMALGAALHTIPAAAQDLTNAGATITVQTGASLYVGTGGFTNQTGGILTGAGILTNAGTLTGTPTGTLTNAGTLRVDGPLVNASVLDLSTSTDNLNTLEVRGDFTNTGTITPGNSPVTFNGPANQLLTAGGATLYQLVLNKTTAGANILSLAGDLTVSNRVNLLSGLMTTKSSGTVYVLRLPNGASLSNEATGRYVVGSVQITRAAVSGAAVNFGHGAVLDPTTNNLGSVVITRTAGLLTDDVSRGVNFGNTSYKGIDRIWTISPTTQPSAAVQLTLSWLPDNDNGITDFTQARIFQQSAAGQPWAVRGPVANASGRSISMNPTTLARFTVSNAANPLPVTLLDFTARAEGPAAVRLAWTTASELNNAGFTVERSLNAHLFEGIGTVAGAGTSTVHHDYALLDNKLPSGATLLYYRLQQTDLDGTLTYSPVRTVALTARAAGFVVYPTKVPVGQAATYLYTGPAGAGTLQVLDMLGRVVRTAPVDGRAKGEVPLAGLASGSYLLRYTSATASFGGRCVVE